MNRLRPELTAAAKRGLLLLFAAALFIRVLGVFAIGEYRRPNVWESGVIARALLEGHGFAFDWRAMLGETREPDVASTWWPPVYPAFLAACRALAPGSPYLLANLLQAALSAALPLLLFGLGRRLFGERAGWIAAAIAAVHPPFIGFVALIQTATLEIFFTALAIYLVFRAGDGGRARWAAFLAGVAIAVASLTRPPPLILVAIAPLGWLAGGMSRPRALRLSCLLWLGVATLLAPWVARNHAVRGEWVLISSNGGWNLFLGNNPEATADRADLARAVAPPLRERLLEMNEVQGDRYLRGLAFDYIREHPAETARNVLARARNLVWFNPDFGKSSGYSSAIQRWTRPLYKASWTLLLLLGLAGMWSSRGAGPGQLVLYGAMAANAAVILATFFVNRYRAPIEPILILYAGAALARLGRRARPAIGGAQAAALVAGGLLMHAALAPETALADAAGGVTSDHETRLILRGLKRHNLRVEPDPDGKTIERIVVLADNVFGHDDPWPMAFNRLRTTTRRDVIKKELLFAVGDAWDSQRVRESGRNLRRNLYISSARVVACRGSAPDRVVALVVTRDLWSLEVEADFAFVGSRLERLELAPTEKNLLGRNKRLGVAYNLDLGSHRLTQEYSDPRVGGSRVAVSEAAGLVWNRSSSAQEGGLIGLAVTRPLFSLETKWAWTVSAEHTKDVFRLFSAGRQSRVLVLSTGETLPYEYRRRVTKLVARATRSFGDRTKHNVSFGWQGTLEDYKPPALASPVQPATLSAFESGILPRSEEAATLLLTYRLFRADYVEVHDINTFGITEDLRLGPDLFLETGTASHAFGFTSTYFESRLTLLWRWKLGDDYLTLDGMVFSRYQQDVLDDTNWVNRINSFGVRNVSPRIGGVRIHTAARLLQRFDDLDHGIVTLGGDGVLRGYPSQYLTGPQSWSANIEARSAPLRRRAGHLGLAAFVDVGDTFKELAGASAHASAGAGLRLGFPQFNRAVMRIDFAVPWESLRGQSPSYLTVQFGQAF